MRTSIFAFLVNVEKGFCVVAKRSFAFFVCATSVAHTFLKKGKLKVKKILSAVLVFVLMFSISACGKNNKEYENLSIDKTEIELLVGNTYTYTITDNDEEVELKDFVWQSSNVDIATVSEGTVTAIKDGTSIITAVIDNKVLTSTVTVKSKIQTESKPETSSQPQTTPSQTTPSQTTPSQTTPLQTTPSQTTPSQTKPSNIDRVGLNNITVLPKEISKVNDDTGYVYYKFMVNDFSIKKEDTEDGRVLAIITYNCVKTYDEDGPTSATWCPTQMIIRKNGVIVDTVRILPDANGMIVSQEFKLSYRATYTPDNDYTFELIDYVI